MVKVCLIVGLLLLCSSAAFARQQAQVKLTLTVTDQTEAPIPGAHVTATNDQTGEQSDAKTDRLGAASILLNKGDYNLKAQAPGFFW